MKSLSWIFGIFVCLIFFQNCNKVSFSDEASQGSLATHCAVGKKLGIWSDPDGTGIRDPKNYLGTVVTYTGQDSAEKNYNYFSASSHPRVGPTPAEYASHVYFYDGADGLHLNFYFNVDEKGSPDNSVSLDLQVQGNGLADKVVLSDDDLELKMAREEGDTHFYEGRFQYWHNTDGGVIGPFRGEAFNIRVAPISYGDLRTAIFYSADGSRLILKDSTDNKPTAYIIAFQGYENCNE